MRKHAQTNHFHDPRSGRPRATTLKEARTYCVIDEVNRSRSLGIDVGRALKIPWNDQKYHSIGLKTSLYSLPFHRRGWSLDVLVTIVIALPYLS